MRWIPVKGFEGLYEVSENGDVLSVSRTVLNRRERKMKVKGRLLKPSTNDWDYKIVNLYKDGKQHCKQIHRLVAEAFIPPFNGEQVNHIDGNKHNNSIENLEWCSGSENMEHAYKNGLHSKATPVRLVELDMVFPSISEAARFVDGKVSGIWRCLSGRNKTHRGYHFEHYKEDEFG